MEMNKIHVFARSLLRTHGGKAELEAAQRAIDATGTGKGARRTIGVAFRPRSRRCVVRT
jgi:hypothetical protein